MRYRASTEITAQTAGRKTPKTLILGGVIRDPAAGMDAVTSFIDSLRTDPVVSRGFSSIRLGNLEGSGSSRFRVICETVEDDS